MLAQRREVRVTLAALVREDDDPRALGGDLVDRRGRSLDAVLARDPPFDDGRVDVHAQENGLPLHGKVVDSEVALRGSAHGRGSARAGSNTLRAAERPPIEFPAESVTPGALAKQRA